MIVCTEQIYIKPNVKIVDTVLITKGDIIITINLITSIGVSGGIIGAYMVSQGCALEANVIWLCCNPFLLYHNLKMGERGQALMFGVYTILAIIGVYNLWLKP